MSIFIVIGKTFEQVRFVFVGKWNVLRNNQGRFLKGSKEYGHRAKMRMNNIEFFLL